MRGFGFLQPSTDGGAGFGQIVQALRERVVIHHGAADNQRQALAGVDFAHQARAVAHKIRRAVCRNGADDVNQMVRHGDQLSGAGLGGADVHVAVHQCAVQADDFAGKVLRDGKGKGGFAAGGCAEYGEGFGLGHDVFCEQKWADYTGFQAAFGEWMGSLKTAHAAWRSNLICGVLRCAARACQQFLLTHQ